MDNFIPHVTAMVAVDRTGAIGKDGDLGRPRVPDDMDRLQKITLDHPVIMMRKTWDSIPRKYRPLSDRTNIVVSRSPAPADLEQGVIWVNHSVTALQKAYLAPGGSENIFVIGGGEGYKLFMPAITTIDLTQLDLTIEGADAYFPNLGGAWNTNELGEYVDDKTSIKYTVRILTRQDGWRPVPTCEVTSARGPEYKAQIRAINSLGECPFCWPNGFTWLDQEIVHSRKHWAVIRNANPLPGTEYHFVIISKKHVETLAELPNKAIAELGRITGSLRKYYNLEAGALTMREGTNPSIIGQSVRHLHAQYLVPKQGEIVKVWLGRSN